VRNIYSPNIDDQSELYGTAGVFLQKRAGPGQPDYGRLAANLNVNAAKCSSFASGVMRANIVATRREGR
jgi:hypothetical protein